LARGLWHPVRTDESNIEEVEGNVLVTDQASSPPLPRFLRTTQAIFNIALLALIVFTIFGAAMF